MSAPLFHASAPARLIARAVDTCKLIPYSLIAFIGRFAISAVFWKSGQTKVQGFAVDIIAGEFDFGVPSLSASAIPLFSEEYKLPLLSPEVAAYCAATAEHLFPVLLLLGIATRFSALALLIMTLTIQLFVYPDAYPVHGVWAAVLLMLAAKGPGKIALDHVIAKHYGYR